MSDTALQFIGIPEHFAKWFAKRGWSPHPHQLALLENIQQQKNTLLIAPTGAGKTLAGFLPSLVDLSTRKDRKKSKSIHTLYISPLKALAVDIERNLEFPIRDLGLDIRVETRTGDTPTTKRARQVQKPPDILLTTPEQVSLLLAHREAANFFSDLKIIIIDELHAIAPTKRGELLSLALARLRQHAPALATIGLSATVRNKDELRSYLVAQDNEDKLAELIEALGFYPAVIVGHSAGAALALRLGMANSKFIESVISLNGALLPLPGLWGQVFAPAAQVLDLVPGLAQLTAWRSRRSDWVDRLLAGTGSVLSAEDVSWYRRLASDADHVKAVMDMMARWDLAGFAQLLPSFQGRVDLLAASRDTTVPASEIKRAALLLPHARSQVLRDLGHLAHEEAPQTVASWILELLNRR
ncbi:MAG: alpha/beta fold hydrolase [Betaproteobacteria bacterium]|nr:alpha/beta fold hydrolase [Betaproteobacteria bacterium]